MNYFFEFCNEMLCVADSRGYFTRVNQAWTKTLGWSTEEMTSRPFIDFVHPDDVETTIREAQLLHSGTHETIMFDNRYRCRDGSYRWLSWQAKLVPDTNELIATARDVTTQKLQAEALRESEERFRILANRAPIGIAQADAEGSVFYANDKWCELAGVTQQEAMGFAWKDFIHADDFSRVFSHWQSHLSAGKDMPPVEFRFLHRNGEIRWASSSSTLLKDATGGITGQIVAEEDITERKVAEHALRESEDRFQAFMNNSPAIAWAKSEQGRIAYFNKAYEERFDVRLSECQGKTDFDLWPDEIARNFRQNDEHVMASDSPISVVEQAVDKNGAQTHWMIIKFPYRDGQGRKYVGGVGIDISELKRTEEQLRLRESQLSGILDNTTAVIYLKDSEGCYLLTNRRFQDFVRNGDYNIIGKKDADVFPVAVARKFRDADALVWQEQRPLDFEEVVPEADGLHTFRSVKFPVRDESGAMIALGGISTDITDLKIAHDELNTKQRLLRNLIEVQEEEKQRLCHDFHDGLIQYAVGAQMLLEGYRQKHPSSEVIDTVIGNLSKGIEDGRRSIRGVRPAVLDDSGLEAAIEDLIEQFSNSEIMVTSKCDPGIGRLPESIQTAVYRVMQESLNNATKYSGTDVVRIELKKQGNELLLEVRDFGCGFDVLAARKKGFGLLGMTERVRLLGGECLIESEPEVGTRISVRLPIPDRDADDGLDER